jgi:alkyl sulfatase BDS1-like metallo-beta-lactamase superfamily hydrolase
VFTDTGDQAVLELRNGSLNHSLDRQADDADATVSLPRAVVDAVIMGEADLLNEAKRGAITVEPDIAPLAELVALLDTFSLWFNVIEP